MKKKFISFLAFLIFLIQPLFSFASHTKVSLLSQDKSIQPGHPILVGIYLQMDKDWHTYWKNPGDSGMPTKVIWTLPTGVTAGELQWPEPLTIVEPPLTVYGYQNEVLLISKLEIPQNISQKSLEIKAKVQWLECKDICLPGTINLNLTLPVSDSVPEKSADAALFEKFLVTVGKGPVAVTENNSLPQEESHINIIVALLFAFLGGLILNLMPCVLPVLSIKALPLFKHSSKSHTQIRTEGILYAFGILVSFWILVSSIFFFKSRGTALGWGFQLQSPEFVAMMGAVFIFLALNLFGVFEIGTEFIRLGSAIRVEHPYPQSFMNGVLATIVATPCTAPFMGSALGYALTQTWPIAIAIFTSLGLGLAFPFLIISFFPKLFVFLPKPGAWMETLKKFFGFLLLATVVWLLWVLQNQTQGQGTIIALGSYLLIGFGCWIFGTWGTPIMSPFKKRLATFSWILLIGIALFALHKGISMVKVGEKHISNHLVNWEPYSDELVSSYRAQNKFVFVDFTADWCLTCQVNERLTFHSDEVIAKIRELDIKMIKADWTDRRDDITNALTKLGRSGVPANVLYKPNEKNPIILSEILTASKFLDAFKEGEKK